MRTLITLFVFIALSPALQAAEDEGAIGYTGPRIQLAPFLAPYVTPAGPQYEVLTIRLRLPEGVERPGCWLVPIVHEKILMYLYDAKLKRADFQGERREALRENIFKVVIKARDRSVYTNLTFVDSNSDPISQETDPRSATLSTQCK